MKTIGLIGGMTWHSTLEYYRLINAGVHQRLGGSHSARCILYSVDFDEVERLQGEGGWEALSGFVAEAAGKVERAGADMLLICANTMHKTAEAVEAAVSIPLIHIADAAAAEIQEQGLRTVGLLGTRFTMELDFYRERLEQRHGLMVLIPNEEERETVHDIIYRELGRGIILESSREAYKAVIRSLQLQGAEGIILGCTEIPLLIRPEDCPLPSFDTTAIHAKAAVDMALPH
ncbi:MAG: aspartate/glutamate racemase family protein [Acidobacteria bacterium]|nr:aspartate/glutamate racemase family protein [Acidobacteriota bacterium]